MLIVTCLLLTACSAVDTDPLSKNLENAYWRAYQPVVMDVLCDSVGFVEAASLLYDMSGNANTDSLAAHALTLHVPNDSWSGRTNAEGLRWVLIFPTHSPYTPSRTPPSRQSLESAGMSSWLQIWDEVLPAWPVDEWRVVWPTTLVQHELPSPHTYSEYDSVLDACELVSEQPGGGWRIDPFYGYGDAETGFCLSKVGEATLQVGNVGSAENLHSAYWLNASRYVVVGTGMVLLGVPKDTSGHSVSYRVPRLFVGDIDNASGYWLEGPPVPVEQDPRLRELLSTFRESRYPQFGAFDEWMFKR